ncbi:MAG: DUF1080 domain-containing protein, partial [Planctomycetales bacterium]|nr:DUF1080 domain-containing protein [Planctomycetales bacterium]
MECFATFVMRVAMILIALVVIPARISSAQSPSFAHPDTTTAGWRPLYADDLSDAEFRAGTWTCTDGVFTASEDEVLWAKGEFDDCTLDLEFKLDSGTNSGVIVYCTDTANWIPNSVEVQITDDSHQRWATSPRTWQCSAIFGHLAASQSVVKKPGQWNRFTINCRGKDITVALNGKLVTHLDMAKFSDTKKNPDGSEIPEWLSRPMSELATKGRIGLQGKHG